MRIWTTVCPPYGWAEMYAGRVACSP